MASVSTRVGITSRVIFCDQVQAALTVCRPAQFIGRPTYELLHLHYVLFLNSNCVAEGQVNTKYL